MKHEVRFRIIVIDPLEGVEMQVQRGKDKLLAPKHDAKGTLIFEFPISVDLSGQLPNFLGEYAQGPKSARFVYVNSGTYAGQHHSLFGRRAKLSLMDISKNDIENVLNGNSVLATSFPGVGRDGGPTCASVKGIVWKVTK